MTEAKISYKLNLENTKIAFDRYSDKELRDLSWLYNKLKDTAFLSRTGKLLLWGIHFKLPFLNNLLRKNIFNTFAAGETLLNSQKSINVLLNKDCSAYLEPIIGLNNTSEDALNKAMNEIIRSIDFAKNEKGVKAIIVNITDLAPYFLLEKIQSANRLSKVDLRAYRVLLKRMDNICHRAEKVNVSVFFEAKASWVQKTIDHLAFLMMSRYNKKRAVVYNTFQMYKKDSLENLVTAFDLAKKKGVYLGAKIVKGAFYKIEKSRAKKRGDKCPIHFNITSIEYDFNMALKFLIKNHTMIFTCIATHNAKSNALAVELMEKYSVPKYNGNVCFAHRFGVAENLTFNLSDAGFSVAKYLPYGKINDIIPFFIKRISDNPDVHTQFAQEHLMVTNELTRRKTT